MCIYSYTYIHTHALYIYIYTYIVHVQPTLCTYTPTHAHVTHPLVVEVRFLKCRTYLCVKVGGVWRRRRRERRGARGVGGVRRQGDTVLCSECFTIVSQKLNKSITFVYFALYTYIYIYVCIYLCRVHVQPRMHTQNAFSGVLKSAENTFCASSI